LVVNVEATAKRIAQRLIREAKKLGPESKASWVVDGFD
jgi:hypothetical protein